MVFMIWSAKVCFFSSHLRPEIAHNRKRVEDVDKIADASISRADRAFVSSPIRMILVDTLAERLSGPAGDHPAVVRGPSQPGEHDADTDDHDNGWRRDVRMRSLDDASWTIRTTIAGAEDDKAEIGRELVEQSGPDALVPAGVVALPRYGEISRLGMSRSGRIAQAWRLLSVVGLRVG